MSHYYDRQGQPMTREEWMVAWDGRIGSRIVARDTVGDYRVSTVWLGLNHNHWGGPPLIFETMVFEDGDWSDLYMERYSTEVQAVEGHARVVDQLRAGVKPEDLP